MGMYTGLRFKAVIKEEFREAIKEFMEEGLDWDQMKAYYPSLEPLTVMEGYSRGDFIPHGSVELTAWEIKDATSKFGYRTPSEWLRNYDEKTGIRTFQCSLKNYDSTIDYFLENVAAKIVEEVIHIETLYEGDRYGTFYKLENEELIRYENKEIDYRPWEDEEEYY